MYLGPNVTDIELIASYDHFAVDLMREYGGADQSAFPFLYSINNKYYIVDITGKEFYVDLNTGQLTQMDGLNKNINLLLLQRINSNTGIFYSNKYFNLLIQRDDNLIPVLTENDINFLYKYRLHLSQCIVIDNLAIYKPENGTEDDIVIIKLNFDDAAENEIYEGVNANRILSQNYKEIKYNDYGFFTHNGFVISNSYFNYFDFNKFYFLDTKQTYFITNVTFIGKDDDNYVYYINGGSIIVIDSDSHKIIEHFAVDFDSKLKSIDYSINVILNSDGSLIFLMCDLYQTNLYELKPFWKKDSYGKVEDKLF